MVSELPRTAARGVPGSFTHPLGLGLPGKRPHRWGWLLPTVRSSSSEAPD